MESEACGKPDSLTGGYFHVPGFPLVASIRLVYLVSSCIARGDHIHINCLFIKCEMTCTGTSSLVIQFTNG